MNEPDPLARHRVTVTGNLQAPHAMVFVHGFGTDQRVWSQIVPAFAGRYRVVLFDNAGAGGSDPQVFAQHKYLSLRGYARDLLEICAALQLQDAVLVGHSLGAMVCVLAAVENPRVASRLVLIGGSPRYLDDGAYRGGFTNADLDQVYSAATADREQWAAGFAQAAMGNADRPHLASHLAESLQAVPAEHLLTILCSIFQSDHRQELRRLDKPTLIVQSREDFVVPLEVARYMERAIRGSRLRIIDATGHLPHVSAPAEVIAAMGDIV